MQKVLVWISVTLLVTHENNLFYNNRLFSLLAHIAINAFTSDQQGHGSFTLGRAFSTAEDYTPLKSLDQFFHQCSTVLNVILCTFKILLNHRHKQQVR